MLVINVMHEAEAKKYLVYETTRGISSEMYGREGFFVLCASQFAILCDFQRPFTIFKKLSEIMPSKPSRTIHGNGFARSLRPSAQPYLSTRRTAHAR